MTALQTTLGTPWLNISIFALFVIITLVIVIRVSSGGRIAIAGDYLSAASFLGIAGAVAFYGYDGLLYSIGFLVAWLVALLLVAEPLRNTGKYTMADVLSFRMQNKPVRTAAAISTLAVSFFYLLAQMAGAGTLVALLLGISADLAQMGVIAIVGLLMITYVLIGGMKGTTWVQMIKAVLLIIGAAILFFWVLGKFGFNLSDLMGAAAAKGNSETAGAGDKLLHAMSKYGTNKLGFISLSIALVLGTAGLPHVLMRFYTVPTAKEARRSVSWAISLIGAFYLFTLVLGFGAAAIVGRRRSTPFPASRTRPLRHWRSTSPAQGPRERCSSRSSLVSRSRRSSLSSPVWRSPRRHRSLMTSTTRCSRTARPIRRLR